MSKKRIVYGDLAEQPILDSTVVLVSAEERSAISWVTPRCESPMPKIFEKEGYRFFFYSNEHRPIHVHVRHGDGEAVFNVEETVELRESQKMKVSELSKAQQLAEEHRQLILEKWHEHLG